MLFYIHPIVPHASAFLHSFLFPVTVVKSIGPTHHIFLLLGTGILLMLFYIHPIVPHASAFSQALVIDVVAVSCLALILTIPAFATEKFS